jgi:hypothetical protein
VIALPAEAQGALAVGWATVELERAADELSHLLAPDATFEAARGSVILGARCLVGLAADGPGLRIVLLEPDTEGRLAATLARAGEGWAARWARHEATGTDARSGTGPRLSVARPGPLGDERLLLGGPFAGSHRLFTEAVPSPP